MAAGIDRGKVARMAESLYRKYRPQIFEDVVGQEHIERTLKNAIEQDKVSHAYLFCGPRGTGKTTTARLLAKALLCEKGPTPDPDGTCEDCRMIAAGEHPDVNELDAASRTGVENVREEIIGRVQFAPTRGRYKVYIIDEVHMLSPAAFNALLKTLEEPPSHVVFILCTTDPQSVPETIHSRCQRFDFRRISIEAMVSRLGAICVKEGVEFEGEALDLIAHRADGGMRNALTSLEQVIVFSDGAVTLEAAERVLGSLDSSDFGDIVGAIGRRDAAACFRWTADYVETGADLAQFTRDLAQHVRNLYVMTLAGADVALEVGPGERRELEAELPLFAPDRLARLLGVLGELSSELKTSMNPRLSFEIALTRMVRPDSDLTLESLAERVEALESGYSAVAHVSSVPVAAAGGGASPQAGSLPRAAAEQPAVESAPAPAGEAFAQASPARPQARSETRFETRPAGEAAAQAAPAASMASEMPATSAAEPAPMGASGGRGAHRADGSFGGAPDAAASATAPATASGAAGAAGASAQLAASLGNPAALQRVWQSALSSLKKEKAAFGVLFLNTKAVFDAAAGALSIDFPVENTFAFKAAQKPDVQDAVASALERACGERLAFSYTQGAQRVSLGGGAPRAQEPQASARAVEQPQRGEQGQPRSSAQQQSGWQPQPQPQPQGGSESRTAPEARFASEPQPAVQESSPRPRAGERGFAEPAAASGGFGGAPSGYDAAPYDDDVVPYDDDAVPYDDAAAYGGPAFQNAPAWEPPERGAAHGAAPRREAGPQRPVAGEPASPSEGATAGAEAFGAPAAHARDAAPAPAERADAAAPMPAEPAAASAAASADAAGDARDLQAILSAGFGDGITFEEVRE